MPGTSLGTREVDMSTKFLPLRTQRVVEDLEPMKCELCVVGIQGWGQSSLRLWGIRAVDIKLDLKGLGGLCQKGRRIPCKGNSVGKGSTFERETARRSLT